MASFYDITVGQQVEFQRVLASTGFTSKHIVSIIKEPTLAAKMLEAIKSASVVQTPSWYVSPEQQLERVRQLNEEREWGFGWADIPAVPQNVELRDGEVLLLCVYLPDKDGQKGLHRTIHELWDLYEGPRGHQTKWNLGVSWVYAQQVSLAPGHVYTPGLRWVAFRPNAYQGDSPAMALANTKEDGVQLAGVEVLAANLLFPTWSMSWNGRDSLHPMLSGLRFMHNGSWIHVLHLERWWDDDEQLVFGTDSIDTHHMKRSSPTIREC